MSRVIELENEITGLESRRLELLKQLELEKSKQGIEIPFTPGNEYFVIEKSGRVTSHYWTSLPYHSDIFLQGNAFNSEKEAERECKKRILLTKFRQFRDKCNGDWKPDWDNVLQDKFHISYIYKFRRLDVFSECRTTKFSLFGYFKNQADCFSAIGLFGDEIKRLFLEAEYE